MQPPRGERHESFETTTARPAPPVPGHKLRARGSDSCPLGRVRQVHVRGTLSENDSQEQNHCVVEILGKFTSNGPNKSVWCPLCGTGGHLGGPPVHACLLPSSCFVSRASFLLPEQYLRASLSLTACLASPVAVCQRVSLFSLRLEQWIFYTESSGCGQIFSLLHFKHGIPPSSEFYFCQKSAVRVLVAA